MRAEDECDHATFAIVTMRIPGVNIRRIVKPHLPAAQSLTWKIRALLAFFILALVISGLTAFPLAHELNVLIS
jgi:hypothetical protein